jgi:hypothetical protein
MPAAVHPPLLIPLACLHACIAQVEQYIKSKRDMLVELQKSLLAFEHIIASEGLAAADADVAAEMNAAIEEFQRYGQQYDEEKLKEQITESLQVRDGGNGG